MSKREGLHHLLSLWCEANKHLPLIGLIGLVVNSLLGIWVHPRERLLARLLWVGAASMQAVLVVAVVRLLQ